MIRQFGTCEVPGHSLFLQAEAGIGDVAVTGVQTCALPICRAQVVSTEGTVHHSSGDGLCGASEIGRASCRERGEISVGAVSLKKKAQKKQAALQNDHQKRDGSSEQAEEGDA